MRRLWPDAAEIDDVFAHVAATPRPRPPDRPWLLVNMVASLDGAVTVDERSGPLARPADKQLFSALRAVADVVLVGAGTARAEGYGPPRPSDSVRAARTERGQASVPRIAIATRTLDLDLASPLFVEAEQPPLLFVSETTPTDRRAAAAPVAEVVVAGGTGVDPRLMATALHERGVDVVTCEGGPHFNGDLIAADVIDEWALTVSPVLTGGGTKRAAEGNAPPHPVDFRLDQVLEGDGMLLTRWLRAR